MQRHLLFWAERSIPAITELFLAASPVQEAESKNWSSGLCLRYSEQGQPPRGWNIHQCHLKENCRDATFQQSPRNSPSHRSGKETRLSYERDLWDVISNVFSQDNQSRTPFIPQTGPLCFLRKRKSTQMFYTVILNTHQFLPLLSQGSIWAATQVLTTDRIFYYIQSFEKHGTLNKRTPLLREKLDKFCCYLLVRFMGLSLFLFPDKHFFFFKPNQAEKDN